MSQIKLAIAFTNENGKTSFDDGYSNPGSNDFAGAKKFSSIEELLSYVEERGCVSSCFVVDENENVILEKLPAIY